MKNIFFLFAMSIVVTSCNVAYVKYKQVTAIGDFRKYTEEGFFISTLDSPGLKYSPVGVVEIEFYPGHIIKNKMTDGVKDADVPLKKPVYIDPLYDIKDAETPTDYHIVNPSKVSNYEYFNPNYDYQLAELVLAAKKMNANAILDLKILQVTRSNEISPYKYIARGYAVRIDK